MDVNERRLLFMVLEKASAEDLIEVAALAQVAAERQATFCRDPICARRVGMHHDFACSQSTSIDDTVHASDCIDVPSEVEARLMRLRSGMELPTLRPIMRKVVNLRGVS